jgi:hypothetical protein
MRWSGEAGPKLPGGLGFGPGSPRAPSSSLKDLRFVIGCWALSRLFILGPLALVAGRHGLKPFPELLLSWDTVHYLNIAREGANDGELAFFPFFPWLLRVLTDGSDLQLLVAAMLLNNAAFLGVLFLLHRQARQLWGEHAANWTIAISSFNPFSIFCSIPYTESLYLLFTGSSLWFSLSRSPGPGASILSGSVGAMAAATRASGIVLMPALLIAGLQRKRSLLGLLAAALPGLGLVAVVVLCWKASGDLLAFRSAQAEWGLTPGLNLSGLPSWTRLISQILIGPVNTAAGSLIAPLYPLAMAVIVSIGILAHRIQRHRPNLGFALGAVAVCAGWILGGGPFLNGTVVVVSVALLFWGWKRIPLPYGVFAVLSLVSYLLKQSTISMERHLYATVPILLLGGLWCSLHLRWARFLIVFGTLLAVTFSLRLSRGEWVG